MRMTFVARQAFALVLSFAGASAALAQADDAPGDPPAQSQQKLQGGGYVCTATNSIHTQQCTASCASRETADCEDADGGGAPTCQCTKG